MVEFALLTPLIFLMMVGAADFARIFFNAIAVANASGAGSIYGAMSPTRAGDYSTIQALAEDDAADLQAPTATATVYCECPAGNEVNCIDGDCGAYGQPRAYSVTEVEQNFELVLPWPGLPDQFAINRRSLVRIQ